MQVKFRKDGDLCIYSNFCFNFVILVFREQIHPEGLLVMISESVPYAEWPFDNHGELFLTFHTYRYLDSHLLQCIGSAPTCKKPCIGKYN